MKLSDIMIFAKRRSLRRMVRRKKAPKPIPIEVQRAARVLVHQKLAQFNLSYAFQYHRVAIRNQSTRWGSCSSKGNLNFNYRIIFLPPELQDYLIVHELCHLKELNHGKKFWELVSQTIPDYERRKKALHSMDRMIGHHA